MKIIVTIRSERLRVFQSQHESALSPELSRIFQMPPLNGNDLLQLAKILPVNPNDDRNTILSRRAEIAKKISAMGYDSTRQPGLAVAILESGVSDLASRSFSATAVYTELFNREVLNVVDARPKTPWRSYILRSLATALRDRLVQRVGTDDSVFLSLHLIDPTTGRRSADYEALLATNILAEVVEDFISYVSFVDLRFYGFVAAQALPDAEVPAALSKLCLFWRRYSPALSIAAFALLRRMRTTGLNSLDGLDLSPEWTEPLFVEIALLDAKSFLVLFSPLSATDHRLALEILNSLINSGESRLASEAAEIFIKNLKSGSASLVDAHLLRARALYEIDDYRNAEAELNLITSDRSYESLCLQAEILLARGTFEKAREAYVTLLSESSDKTPREKANALAGLGYILGRLGQTTEAEKVLNAALEALQWEGDCSLRAEILGDLSQVLLAMGRIEDARKCVNEDLEIGRKLGHLVGMGVAESLIGEISAASGDLSTAEIHLNHALDIARQVGNQWREAWVLQRLAKLYQSWGRTKEAVFFEQESEKILESIGADSQ